MTGFSVEMLADEGMKLLRLELDELYAVLGGQLLAQNLPTRVAGIVSYLSAVRSASEAKSFYTNLPSEPDLSVWGSGLGVICEELKRDGMDFIKRAGLDLRRSLCNEDIVRLSDQVNRSTMQIVIMIVGATLRLPRNFDAISATVAVILLKIGLRAFCAQGDITGT